MINKMLIICGPTATGKTALALELAKKWNGELVSADSRQAYRGMDIATGKDLPNQLTMNNEQLTIDFKKKKFHLGFYMVDGIPLWMIDVVNPDEEFSVAHYQKFAREVVEHIRQRGKLPIIVGGTGLYIQSLLSPIETSHIPPNKKLRKMLGLLPLEDLQKHMMKKDRLTWETMNQSDRQNPRRLIRKIEIADFYCHREPSQTRRGDPCLPAGRFIIKIASSAKPDRNDTNWDYKMDILLLGLSAPYPVLYQRIDERVEKRVKQGVQDEITRLLKKGYSWDLPSMNTLGYKEWKEFFTNNLQPTTHNLQPIIQRWKWDEHGYARRQMTWFKKMKGIQWFDIAQSGWQEKVESIVKEWYTNRN